MFLFIELFGHGRIGVRRLVDQIHELVETRRYDNLRATVELSSFWRVVGRDGIVFAPAPGSEARGINAEFILQYLYDR